ncbi:uncharacterized protein RJT20DRAFT_129202 [Scheffersomyces xylosifermentans]|uniref:uncharacterized protein n=1 Tax=Scheffersomyces xylosifermentans TaxID=1304137 RepID=UPI00315CD11B
MLELIRELYEIISSSKQLFKIVQLVPADVPSNTGSEAFSLHSEGDTLDIGLTKKTYLKLFKESHTYWHNNIASDNVDYNDLANSCDIQTLWNLYFMTVGFLITTNENHTIVALHETVCFRIIQEEDSEFLSKEFDLITSFLSCRLKRINKSSSLWRWTKKLTISLIFDPLLKKHRKEEAIVSITNNLVERTFKSCQIHFANYYGTSFLRWFLTMLAVLQNHDQPEIRVFASTTIRGICEKLLKACHNNIRDCSLWGIIEVLISGSTNGIAVGYIMEEYNAIVEDINSKSRLKLDPISQGEIPQTNPTIRVTIDVETEVKWLLDVDCSLRTPFSSLIRQYSGGPEGKGETETFKTLFLEKKEKIRLLLNKLEVSSDLAEKNRELDKVLEWVIRTYFN